MPDSPEEPERPGLCLASPPLEPVDVFFIMFMQYVYGPRSPLKKLVAG